VKKVVLAYSGGLDTSVAVAWLKEQYDSEVVTLTVDLGGDSLRDGIAQRALAAGASRAYVVDGRERFVRQFVWPSLQANALYQGVYPLAYYPHNIHFLWDSATMEGRSRSAIEAARKSASKIPDGAWREVPLLHQFLVAPLFAYTRFGQWELILKEPRPPEDSPFWTGVWRYARGLAFTSTGKLDAAAQELNELQKIAALKSLDGLRVTFSRNGAKAILDIAVEVLAGELAAKRGDYEQAIARLHRGILLEDNLIYNEPPDWHVPVRQSLGAVLLAAGRAAEAEAVYWQDLSRNRENGWALFGLMQSLRAEGKEEQAVSAEGRFRKAWSRADVTLSASRFMGETKTAIASRESSRTQRP